MKKILLVLVVILFGLLAWAAAGIMKGGFSARDEPSAIEAFVARRLRLLAIPRDARDMKNPVPASTEVVAEGREHFADHCAICHGNDGSGESDIGQILYPKAPDLRKDPTQSLTDGELFYIIHNGIRFTGMPGWGGGKVEEDHDSWELVQFIRHLPKITAKEIEEMEKLNPKSPHEREEEEEEHGAGAEHHRREHHH
jgi:mono/diheme cytochrome c family protein